MRPFDLAEPRSLEEAVSLLDADDPTVRPIAGGTGLMLMMKAGMFQPSRLVSLQRLESGLSGIDLTGEGELRIGALAKLSQVERSDDVARRLPVLARALTGLANVRVRNVARVGGSLAHGDPHMDLPPIFAALGARVGITGPNGRRVVPVEDLYVGYYESVLELNELIHEVLVPSQAGRHAAYVKVTTRTAHDWPSLGIAVSFSLDDRAVAAPRIVVSAATDRPMRLGAAESALDGQQADAATLARVGDAAAADAPITADATGSIGYKRELLRVHIGRAVQQAIANGPGQ